MDQLDERVFAQLRKLGLRPTSARICVLQVLHAHTGDALAVDQIFLALNAIDISISLGTIYRVLNELEERKLVRREWDAQQPAAKSRYVLATDSQSGPVYELVCPICARRHRLNDPPLVEALQRQVRTSGFAALPDTVSISVPCGQCAL